MKQRKLLKTLSVLAVTSGLLLSSMPSSPAMAKPQDHSSKLKFNNDGSFKIVQFTDTQDGPNTDKRTIQLMNDMLDSEKPNLVLITGDVIDGRSNTAEEVKQAIDNIAKPMEDRDISWAITFGNHDEDHTSKTGMDREDMMQYYMSFENNINTMGDHVSQGRVGDGNITIKNSKGNKDVFNVYLFDSGSYANKDEADLKGYGYITPEQISWYRETSDSLAKKNGGNPVPSLAFMHIPVPEYNNVLLSPGTGSWNETPCPPTYNTGLFMSMKEKKDVKGIYVGHDHINDFEKSYVGIKLGYAANTGYGTYGLGGANNHNMRGARVFELNESDVTNYTSRMVYHKDIQENIVEPTSLLVDEDFLAETLEFKKSMIE